MNITILEDRPLIMMESIKEMEEMGIHTAQIVYYIGNEPENSYREKVRQKCEERDIRLLQVDDENFTEQMDRLYEDQDMTFFFDLFLKYDDNNKRIEEWFNVIYAKNKKDLAPGGGRIWFYTTAPAALIEQLNVYFPDRNIPVEKFKATEQQVILDYDYIKEHILKRK